MSNRLDRQLKQFFLIACALLMLALPANIPADYQPSANQHGQDAISKPINAMTSDIGLAGSGLSGEAKAVLKPYERLVRDRGTAHSSLKAIANDIKSIASIAYCSTVRNTQIHVQAAHSGSTLCCRAPPAFFKL